ncbi:MAG: hypothetical protein ACLT8E_12485 [Akkermansia sp.]
MPCFWMKSDLSLGWLARFLQERLFPVGATGASFRRPSCRHQPLEVMAENKDREDLYYRLNIPIVWTSSARGHIALKIFFPSST